ncbi:MAG TPA: terminase, partial [Algoriphagus sp.]|nr:terminase [Algoriphagus sp.]
SASLEGINWYRAKLAEYKGDMVSMASEYPSDDVEAFQSSGQRFFPVGVVQKARRFVKPPIYVGEIYADAQKGPEALNNIRMERANEGNLSVWSDPEKYPDIKFLNRYCVTVDI